jgi:hypothetical protein
MTPKLLIGLFLAFIFCNCLGGALVDKGGYFGIISHSSSATVIRSDSYKVLGTAEGESSVYYLLGLIPVTSPLNIDYALSQAVQQYPGGGSMINLRVWTEVHYYFPVGKVYVLKVKGDVVDLKESLPLFEQPGKGGGGKTPTRQPPAGGGISVGGKKKKQIEGGINVGGGK